MKTAKQREDKFRVDLKVLMKKHGAEINITDDGKSHGMHSGICLVTMMSQYDKDNEMIAEYTEFNL